MSIEVLNESGEAEVNEQMLIDVASFAMRSMDVHPETLHEMWLMEQGSEVPSIRVAQIHRATVAHLQFNLETGLKSFKIMEQA